jgi:hypothetical protein
LVGCPVGVARHIPFSNVRGSRTGKSCEYGERENEIENEDGEGADEAVKQE